MFNREDRQDLTDGWGYIKGTVLMVLGGVAVFAGFRDLVKFGNVRDFLEGLGFGALLLAVGYWVRKSIDERP